MLGPMAQLVRAFGSHPKGHRFESCWAHSCRWQACEAIRRPAKNTGFFAGFFVWGTAFCGCLRTFWGHLWGYLWVCQGRLDDLSRCISSYFAATSCIFPNYVLTACREKTEPVVLATTRAASASHSSG